SNEAKLAVAAQLCAALVAGNSVVFCSDDAELTSALSAAYEQSTLPANLLQFATFDAYHQLMESDIRCMGYVGNTSVERTINRQLAKRSGAIVSLVSETDFAALPVANDPHLSLRFITERTRTINITAVGGNATLLELGNEAH
ncbi:1-pyrroline-5-carboxylate dehydrogenase, partial [Vibrio parahaemolyticus]|nr:1-pyrroline-5-carboxylate dehydrogenase [Vibrio parahaemolyticus]